MSKFGHIENIYFLGIGGIGMSALARYFRAKGTHVAGTDRTPSSLTEQMIEEGIEIIYSSDADTLPSFIKEDPNSLIVYTPAIPRDHPQFKFFINNGFTIKKRAEVLGEITSGIKTIAVAGTHGKTTTTAILAHLLKDAGIKVTAFLGGVSENYHSNLLLGGEEVMVVEADEFDRSFLHLRPDLAAITSMDPDHLDVYGGAKEMEESFIEFSSLLPQDGILFHKKGLPFQGISVGFEEDADVRAENIHIDNGCYCFDFVMKEDRINDLRFGLPGRHNLFNAITALALALSHGAPKEHMPAALETFQGVRRRFSYVIKENNCVLINDYAHHPEEIKAAHQAVREMHPGKEVLAVFQPHLFSRTKDFAGDFAESLDFFDQVILLDIYPAREEAIPGISSEWLLRKIKRKEKKLVSKEELPLAVKASGAQVVLIMGAGDIAEQVEPIKSILHNES